ncbi:hypothetical protein [Chelativorans salis]|uniref:Uncharacterized protein n=1 Tax=Chelativorans salis TaxID=2978478 RepID=A0ABT2LKF1_9HYPH|nr:hypothetical protein [Chelativorans sp. EGI FJ00035]MCT7375082.1 hypothetical protein [Chelativorans sp. EGI FJ00035]
MAAVRGFGFAPAKDRQAGLIGVKLRRVPWIAANGILILIPAAQFLPSKARAAKFDTADYTVQVLELVSGRDEHHGGEWARKTRKSVTRAVLPRSRRRRFSSWSSWPQTRALLPRRQPPARQSLHEELFARSGLTSGAPVIRRRQRIRWLRFLHGGTELTGLDVVPARMPWARHRPRFLVLKVTAIVAVEARSQCATRNALLPSVS